LWTPRVAKTSEFRGNLIKRKAAMTERRNKLLDRVAQTAHSAAPVDRNVLSDPSSAPPITNEPTLRLQLTVRPRHGVRRDREIAGELPHRWERRVWEQLAALDPGANLRHYLLVRRDLELRVNDEIW
jgi:hypothetical protein